MSSKLQQFFDSQQVGKGKHSSHTSLMDPTTNIFVNNSEQITLFQLYADALDKNEDVCLMEKHTMISPVLIDVNLRFQLSRDLTRRYTLKDVTDILTIYGAMLAKYLIVLEIDFYLFEMPSPQLENNIIKDGFHVMVPGISTQPAVQFVVRNQVLHSLETIQRRLRTCNTVKDVFDEATICKNNWLMLESKKPNGQPYLLTHIMRFDCTSGTINSIPKPSFLKSTLQMVEFFSIRNKYTCCETRPEKIDEIKSFTKLLEERQSRKDTCSIMVGDQQNYQKNEVCDLEIINELVRLLDYRRSLDYTSWLSLGWCLRNIDHRMLAVWDEFSKSSSKYRTGVCEHLWLHMTFQKGPHIGSLRRWAKMDNPSGFKELACIAIQPLLYNIIGQGNHLNIARLVLFMYQDDHVCTDIKRGIWYTFQGERWMLDKSGARLRHHIGLEVIHEINTITEAASQVYSRTADRFEKDKQHIIIKRIGSLIHRLGDKQYADDLMGECAFAFSDDTFVSKLDSNMDLVGFQNGVFNLMLGEYRKGKHEDYATINNGLAWLDYDESDPIYGEINQYIDQVFPNPRVRKYVMLILVTFLSGRNPEQKFYIWTGCGSNSKSKLVELFESCMQDYIIKFPVTKVTRKRPASNQCTPELSRSVGKRLAIMHDPDKGEPFNTNVIKEITGSGRIYSRALFSEGMEFVPQFKLLLLCNELPVVNSDDDGTWRRIRTVEFTSKFVEKPTEPNEFLLDKNLSVKMKRWPRHFLALLLHVYLPIYKIEGLQEPQEVMDSTSQYRCISDRHALYISSRITSSSDGHVLKLHDMFVDYRDWCKTDEFTYRKNKKSTKATFFKYARNKFTKLLVTSTTGEIGFKGIKFEAD